MNGSSVDDLVIGTSESRYLSSIPGNFLFKPLEVTVTQNNRLIGSDFAYKALHVLPTQNGNGRNVTAEGGTIDEAVDKLGGGLRYSRDRLYARARQAMDFLSKDEKLQIAYFTAIMRPYNNIEEHEGMDKIPPHLASKLREGVELTAEQARTAITNYFTDSRHQSSKMNHLADESKLYRQPLLIASGDKVDLKVFNTDFGGSIFIHRMHADDAVYLARQMKVPNF